jgi:hypothetical protein
VRLRVTRPTATFVVAARLTATFVGRLQAAVHVRGREALVVCIEAPVDRLAHRQGERFLNLAEKQECCGMLQRSYFWSACPPLRAHTPVLVCSQVQRRKKVESIVLAMVVGACTCTILYFAILR